MIVRTALRFLPFISVAVLAACNFGGLGTTGDSSSSASSESSMDSVVTSNVSFQGTIGELPAATYTGTHSLTLDDGQIVILASTDVNLSLSSYLGKRVEVSGTATVTDDETLLRVEEVTILETASSSSSSASTGSMCGGIAGIACPSGQVCVDDPSDSCDPANGGADCGGVCVMAISSSSSSTETSSVSSEPPVSSSASSVSKTSSSSVSSVASSVQSSANINAEMEAQIVLMAKQTYDQDALWTQKYCTSHVGFCIPVHKNWYFKSFGATTTNLWHVEFGMSDIDELNQGPILLNLSQGSSASMNAESGQIRSQGSDIVGFLDWKDGTHFELIADARLQAAVAYMLANVTPYEPAQ